MLIFAIGLTKVDMFWMGRKLREVCKSYRRSTGNSLLRIEGIESVKTKEENSTVRRAYLFSSNSNWAEIVLVCIKTQKSHLEMAKPRDDYTKGKIRLTKKWETVCLTKLSLQPTRINSIQHVVWIRSRMVRLSDSSVDATKKSNSKTWFFRERNPFSAIESTPNYRCNMGTWSSWVKWPSEENSSI